MSRKAEIATTYCSRCQLATIHRRFEVGDWVCTQCGRVDKKTMPGPLGWRQALWPETTLPVDSQARKDVPLARGVLDYFPAALAAVAALSQAGNDKHNPGEVLHWARGKSMDHADCILRHLIERGAVDTDGLSHTVKVAWRALALLQEELEAAGAPLARGARLSENGGCIPDSGS